jgi:hypothetical protein
MLDELRKNRRLLTFDKPVSQKLTCCGFVSRSVHVFRWFQVDPEEVPDYYEIIKTPMDFSTMMDKIERGEYVW